jgi:hypothetical protein
MGDFYGKEFEYADTRLKDSVVLYNNTPVFVAGVSSSGIATATDLVSNKAIRVPLAALEVSPLSLGYVNFKNCASYFMRMPKRRDWKQGTRPSNVTTVAGPIRFGNSSWVYIANTIRGMFPSFQYCLSEVRKKGRDSCAWHRNWCLSSKGKVSHKGVVVGRLVDNTPTLDGKFKYLEESLKESLNESK